MHYINLDVSLVSLLSLLLTKATIKNRTYSDTMRHPNLYLKVTVLQNETPYKQTCTKSLQCDLNLLPMLLFHGINSGFKYSCIW